MANIIINKLTGSVALELYVEGLQGRAPYPNGEWDYAWCIENWGTKWDLYKGRIYKDGVIYFITANSGIEDWLDTYTKEGEVDFYVTIDIDEGEYHWDIPTEIIAELLRIN
jgi:hypothetical protein